jgi:hypothetical protein
VLKCGESSAATGAKYSRNQVIAVATGVGAVGCAQLLLWVAGRIGMHKQQDQRENDRSAVVKEQE